MTTASGPTAETPATTVVIPTYNERANLPRIVEELLALDGPRVNILVVDDNSPDGTGKVADQLAGTSGGRVSVLHRTVKDGLGRAYVAGLSKALADGAAIVVQMDADLSHPVAAVPEMVRLLSGSATDVVIGSRYIPGGSLDADWPLRRRLLSRWANAYVSRVLRLGVHDTTAGFKGWRAEALHRIELAGLTSNGYCYQIETAYRAQRGALRITEIPIHFAQRTSGTSKMSLRVQAEAAVVPWRLRRSRWTPARTHDAPPAGSALLPGAGALPGAAAPESHECAR